MVQCFFDFIWKTNLVYMEKALKKSATDPLLNRTEKLSLRKTHPDNKLRKSESRCLERKMLVFEMVKVTFHTRLTKEYFSMSFLYKK